MLLLNGMNHRKHHAVCLRHLCWHPFFGSSSQFVSVALFLKQTRQNSFPFSLISTDAKVKTRLGASILLILKSQASLCASQDWAKPREQTYLPPLTLTIESGHFASLLE